MRNSIPYFSQWESRKLAGAILRREIRAEDDPNWRNSGAATRQEYADWSWAGCGLACLRMLLKQYTGATIPLASLGEQSLRYGCYDLPLKAGVGLKYIPFALFAQKEYGLAVRAVAALPLWRIVSELAKGSLVIASVSPEIRDGSARPHAKGGHLVLVVGYDLDRRMLFLHNPSGDTPQSQEYAKVNFRDFKHFSASRGMVIY